MVDGDLLGVAGAAARPHHHREDLGPRARLADADAQRVDDADLLAARLGVAEGLHAHGLGGRDDGCGSVSADLRVRVRGGRGVGAGPERRVAGSGSDAKSLRGGEARAVVAALAARRRQVVVAVAVGRGHADALAVDDAQVDHGVVLGHVLVDLVVGEARQAPRAAHDERLGLGGTGLEGHGHGAVGDLERVGVLVVRTAG